MTNLITFSFKEKPVRVVIVDGEPHWVGKDVCEALGYTNPSKAMNDHCKGVAKRYPLQTEGGIQEFRVLSEADVLRLIVNSRLPEAEKFERLVFEEVLPSIRKTGFYVSPSTQLESLQTRLQIAEMKLQVFEEHHPAKFYDYDEAAALCSHYRKPPFGREHLKRWLVTKGILCKQAAKNDKPIQHYLYIRWFIPVIHEWYRRGRKHSENRFYISPKGLMGMIEMMIRDNLLHIPATPQQVFPELYPPTEASQRLSIADEPSADVETA